MKFVNKYKEFNNTVNYCEDNCLIGHSNLHLFKIDNLDLFIVEADSEVNPSEYTEVVYEKIIDIVTNDNYRVYLDLSNLYGINSSKWLYKWIFKTDIKNELEDEEFIAIDLLKINSGIEYEVLREYLYKKSNNTVKDELVCCI